MTPVPQSTDLAETAPAPAPSRGLSSRLLILLILFPVVGAVLLTIYAGILTAKAGAWTFYAPNFTNSKAEALSLYAPNFTNSADRDDAPEFTGGTAWLNTAGPIRIKDLRGKVVVLDFWTFCCINCIHTLPDLAKLEKKYPNELVIIGVHSAKFEKEKSTEAIRKAILRYEISHPVVNDSERRIWDAYGVESWPTLYLIDPEGKIVARGAGEGLYEPLDKAIEKLIKEAKEKKTLDTKPRKFELARRQENGQSPLFFPGKVLADAASKRLFIADSTHHRIVVTDLDGKKLAVCGMGEPGYVDGTFDKAQFDDPQGMALKGETLYVADRKNHLIRALDLKAQTVKTIAGTGKQGREREFSGPPLGVGLNSPWDLLLHGNTLFIAMAGHHQIWTLDLGKNLLGNYAGTGREDIKDGPLGFANFAQPSGLATDGKNLYVADSEVSSVHPCLLTARAMSIRWSAAAFLISATKTASAIRFGYNMPSASPGTKAKSI